MRNTLSAHHDLKYQLSSTTAYLSIVSDYDRVHPVMTTAHTSLWHTTSQTSNHLRLVPWTWQWVHYTEMASTVTWYQSSRAPLGCSESGDSHHGCGTERSAAVVRCYPVIMDQKLCSTLLKERRQLLSQGVKIRTSKMKGLVSGKVLGESLFFF